MTNKFLLLASIFFISCAGPGTYKIYYEAIKNQIPGDDFLVIEEEFYKEQKFSFAYFKYGSKTPILLVLANTENGILQWVSQDKISIFTNEIGKIIKKPRIFGIVKLDVREKRLNLHLFMYLFNI